jgi:polyhydroxybutyrate depolymerase
MVIRSWLIAFMLLAVTGIYAQSGITVVDSFWHQGSYRQYRLYVPNSYTGSTDFPLIVDLHGLGSDALEQQYYSNFMPIADTADFLVLYPQGTHPNFFWNAGFFLSLMMCHSFLIL